MGSQFLQQFMAGWQMGQGRNENTRRNQELAMEQRRQEEMMRQRAQEFEMQKEEFAVRKKQLAAEEAAHKLNAAKQAYELRSQASSLQGLPAPTAREAGIQQTTPQDVGPTMDQINVPQPMQALPNPMEGQPDIQMPVLTGAQQQQMALAAEQRKNREALGFYEDKKEIDQRYQAPQRPVSVSPGGILVDPQTGKVVFRAPDRPSGGAGSSSGTVGPDGMPTSPFGTAKSEGEKNKVSVAKDAVRNMPKWQDFINKNSDKFGFYAGRATKATQSGMLSPLGVQPDEKTATFMAEIGRMSNDMLNALSGAAISPAEFERLKQQIPQLEDHPTVLNAKMAALDDYFKFRLQNFNAPYEGPGWQRGAAPTPAAGRQPKPGVTIGGVLVEEE